MLVVGLQETFDAALTGDSDAGEAGVVGSLRRGEGGPPRFLCSLGEAWVRGAPVEWGAVFDGGAGRAVRLPTYAFQRRRYWLQAAERGVGDLAAAGQRPSDHPLLGAAVALADGGGQLFTGRLSLQTHPWLADHAVMGAVLLPGTAFLDLALYAGGQVGCELVEDLALQAPLVLDEQDEVQIQLLVGEPDRVGACTVSIYSYSQGGVGEDGSEIDRLELGQAGGAWTCHASGTLAPRDSDATHTPREPTHGRDGLDDQLAMLASTEWPPPGAVRLETEALYDRLAGVGFEYGPAFQGLQAAWRRGEEIFAEVALAEEQRPSAAHFDVHPALLDAALHGIGAARLAEEAQRESGAERAQQGGMGLPFSWSGVTLYSAGAQSLRVCLSPAGEGAVAVAVADGATGAPVAAARSLVVRPVSREQLEGGRRGRGASLLALEWSPIAVEAHAQESGWTTLGELPDEALEGVAHYADLTALCEELDGGAEVPAVVLVGWGLDLSEGLYRSQTIDGPGPLHGSKSIDRPEALYRSESIDGPDPLYREPSEGPYKEPSGGPPGEAEGEGVAERAHHHAREALALLQAWLAEQRLHDAHLVVLTRGAVAVHAGEAVSGLAAAPVWGLVRSAQSEHPGRFTLVDLDGERTSWQALGAALAGRDRSEDARQLAVRDGVALAPRLAHAAGTGALAPPEGASRWRLASGDSGTLEDLRLVACPEVDESLAEGQVRVVVRAASLNFRDVVSALGLVPLRGEWDTIGSEGAGVVMEVGPGVSDLAARRSRDGAAARSVRPGGGEPTTGCSCGCPRAGRSPRPRRCPACS